MFFNKRVYDKDMKRYRIIFRGRVQGVGFRYQMALQAQQNDLGGSVLNLPNGDVEVYLEGEEKRIMEVINYFLHNPHYVYVEDYCLQEVPLTNSRTFNVLY